MSSTLIHCAEFVRGHPTRENPPTDRAQTLPSVGRVLRARLPKVQVSPGRRQYCPRSPRPGGFALARTISAIRRGTFGPCGYSITVVECPLTTELSGRPRCPCRGQTRRVMPHGPLERVVRLHCLHRSLLRRSAIRVCHPGPVAFQRSMTSTGRRIEMSFRGFAERGRPPLFTTARDNASSESSGSSLYSRARMACASTLARSDFKVRRETGLFTIVCLSHAEYVARCTARGVANYNETPGQQAVANDAAFAIVLARVFDLDRDALEDDDCVFKVQPSIG